MNMNGYQCFACSATQTVDFDGFLCPTCGGNLDISYDYAAVANTIDEGFFKGGHDLFQFAALLPLEQPRSPFPLRVGGTPLYQAHRLGGLVGMQKLYLKDDTVNPSASLKDRASAVSIGRALDIGVQVVSVASTGVVLGTTTVAGTPSSRQAYAVAKPALPPELLTTRCAPCRTAS